MKKKKEQKNVEKELIKLDIASGQNKQIGFKGIDIANIPEVDIVHDLTVYPWPIESESVTDAFCSHYIEHVSDLIKFMNELYRILVPGGKAFLLAPYGKSDRALQDPTHVRGIVEASMLYYNKQWREINKLDHYPITCDFDFNYGYVLSPEWANRADEARVFALKHYWNVANDIYFNLTKK